MSAAPPPRRPISRRLMAALFLLMIVPTCGWYFFAELWSDERWQSKTDLDRESLADARGEVRFELALTLVASILTLAGTIAYLRRTVVDPLDDLARRARTVGLAPWRSPPERSRPDEIGDLARALDDGVRALEHRAEEAARFSINLSHELRTPLTAIRGAAEILADLGPDDADRARFVENIVTESARLERLVSGIVELSRLDQSPPKAPSGDVDVLPVVRQVLESTRPLLARKRLRVAPLDDSNGAIVAVEGARLHRILIGLLENAIRFSPPAGEIRIDVRRAGDEVLLAVEDEGPGVPYEIRESIFERQFTTELDGGSAARGSGLGLAIVRSLVSASRGRIWVEDTASTGARFVLALPATPS